VASGAYLVRSKGSVDGEFALSLLTPKRAIHYVIKIPAGKEDPMLFQKKPMPAEWGSNLRSVINHLGRKEESVIPVLLKVPAPIPESNDKLFRIAHKAAQETGASVDHHLYTMVTEESDQYALSTAYEQHPTGVYYRVFYPRSHVTVPVYIRIDPSGGSPAGNQTDMFVEVDANEEMAANMPLYVKLGQDDLGSHLADSPADEDDGQVFYTNVGGDGGNDDDDGVMYTAVDVGNNSNGGDDDDGVMYTAVDVGGNDNGDDDDGVMYTAVDVGDDNNGGDDDDGVMYTAVDLGGDNGQDEDGVMYTAVDLDGHGGGGGQDEDAGVMYTAVDTGGGDEFGGFDDISSTVVKAASIKKPRSSASAASTQPNEYESAPPQSKPRGRAASSSNTPRGERGRGRSNTQSEGRSDSSDQARRRSATTSQATGGGGGGGKSSRGPRKQRAATTSAAQQSRAARSVSQIKGRGGPPPWLHEIDNRKDAEAKLNAEGGEDGMFLVRPRDKTGSSHAFSVKLRGRFIHRLIQKRSDGSYKVDKQEDGWGATLSDVVQQVQDGMAKKHGMAFVPVLRPGATAPITRKTSVYNGFGEPADDDVSNI